MVNEEQKEELLTELEPNKPTTQEDEAVLPRE